MIRSVSCTLMSLGLMFLSPGLLAQETIHVVVDYVAPPDCPPASRFRDALTARLPKGYTVELGSVSERIGNTLGLQLRVSRTQAGYLAELATVTNEGTSSPRYLEGRVCSELTETMTFTAALTVDPNALTTPSTEPRGTPAQPSPAQPSPTPPTQPSPAQPSSAASNQSPAPANEASAPQLPPARNSPAPLRSSPEGPNSHTQSWATSVGAGLGIMSLVSPGISPGVFASLQLWNETPGQWSPSGGLAISGSRFVSPTREVEATFSTAGLYLSLCPSSFRNDHLTLRPCLAGHINLLRATGMNLTKVTDVTIALPSLGPELDVRYSLSSRWFVSAAIGVQVPLQRHRFDVGQPARETASTRSLAPYVSAQLGAFLASSH